MSSMWKITISYNLTGCALPILQLRYPRMMCAMTGTSGTMRQGVTEFPEPKAALRLGDHAGHFSIL